MVAAAHAGWRGLLAGVLEKTVAAMDADPLRLLAWLGPAIGPQAFEVGPEVREAFLDATSGVMRLPRVRIKAATWLIFIIWPATVSLALG